MNLLIINSFNDDLWKDDTIYKAHIETDSPHNSFRNKDFKKFKKVIESQANLIVVPETNSFCLSVFDPQTELLQAYFIPPNGPWKVISSNIYLQLVLPNYNRGTIPNA